MIRINLVGNEKKTLNEKLAAVVMAIFPPVRKYPMKHPSDWKEVDKSNDPTRPLEPGEDWAGNVQTPFLRLDVEKDGRVCVRVARFMKAVHIVKMDERRRQIICVTKERRKSAMKIRFGG
jgi:hypothetical protein